jgi:hypothetical protein
MRDPKDPGTVELPGMAFPPRRGRPPSGKAKSGAQRQADFRARRECIRAKVDRIADRLDRIEKRFGMAETL